VKHALDQVVDYRRVGCSDAFPEAVVNRPYGCPEGSYCVSAGILRPEDVCQEIANLA
jgi:hypothetical protein